MKMHEKSMILGLVCGALLTVSSLAFASINVISDEPANMPKRPPSKATLAEQIQWKNDFKLWAENENKIKHFSGEKTKGAQVIINNQPVKLPNDVYLDGIVVSDEGLERKPEYRKHLPFWIIVRGNSRIMISQNTGVVVNQILDPSDKVPFKFLESYITGYIPEVKQ